jgi:hypothetical protein
LYAAGRTLRSIAGNVGVTFQRVHQILIAEGVTLRDRGHRAAKRRAHDKLKADLTASVAELGG